MEYCAANSYLDVLSSSVDHKNIDHFLSINWLGWSDIGMASRYRKELSADNHKSN